MRGETGQASVLGAISATVLPFCPFATSHAEVVLAVYTGASRTQSSDLHVRQPATGSDAVFSDVHWQGKPFEESPYYGLRISYYPGKDARLGVNLEFTHYKMHAENDRDVAVHGTWNGAPVDETAPMSTRIQHFEISHGVNLSSLNADYRWVAGRGPEPDSRWQPHIGAGLAAYFPHAEGEINGVSVTGDYQLAGWGFQIFGGTGYRVWRGLSVFAEGKYDHGNLAIDLTPGTHVDTRVRTLHAIAGLAWQF